MAINITTGKRNYHTQINNALYSSYNSVVSGIDLVSVTDLTANFSSGEVLYKGSKINVSGTTITFNQGDDSYPRIDLVVFNGTQITILEGTPSADPKPVDYNAYDYVVLYQVYIDVNATSLTINDFEDMRVPFNPGLAKDEMVKADNLDTAAGFLSDKVDNTTLEVDTSSHKIKVKNNAFEGDFKPSDDNTYSLGSSSTRWKELHVGDVNSNSITTNNLNAGTLTQDLDFNQHQAKNLVAHKGDSFPSSPVEGQLFYRTDEHKYYIYNGSKWKPAGGGGLGKFEAWYTIPSSSPYEISVIHNLNDDTPDISVYDNTTNELIEPESIVVIDNNQIKITFGSSYSGRQVRVVIQGGLFDSGGMKPLGLAKHIEEVLVPSSAPYEVTVTHNLNDGNPTVQVYHNNQQIEPQTIEIIDNNNVKIVLDDTLSNENIKVVVHGGQFVNGTATDGDIIPTADDTYTIGNSTYRWKSVYAVNVYTGDLVLQNGWKIVEYDDNKNLFNGVRILNSSGEEIFKITEDGLYFKGKKVI